MPQRVKKVEVKVWKFAKFEDLNLKSSLSYAAFHLSSDPAFDSDKNINNESYNSDKYLLKLFYQPKHYTFGLINNAIN